MNQSVANNEHHAHGPEILSQVRAGFVLQGTSLQAWCREQGLLRQNVRKCLLGEWNGPKAKQLRKKIIEAARVRLRSGGE